MSASKLLEFSRNAAELCHLEPQRAGPTAVGRAPVILWGGSFDGWKLSQGAILENKKMVALFDSVHCTGAVSSQGFNGQIALILDTPQG